MPAKRILTPRICANVLCGKTFYVNLAYAMQSVQQYCSHPCSFRRTPLIDRLLPQIAMCEHGDCIFCCWPWTGCTIKGYGVLTLNKSEKGKSRLAHRLAWEHFRKQVIPADKHACHHCDNPRCCNPDHIYAGTQTQNMQDAKRRGRMNNDTKNYARGERQHSAKLSEQDIHRIWELKRQGMGKHRIAKHFPVTPNTIQAILNLKSWRHVSLAIIAASPEVPEPVD